MNQEITFRSYQIADRRWVVTSNINHYEDCEGFDKSFAGVVHDAVAKLELQLLDALIKIHHCRRHKSQDRVHLLFAGM